MVTVCGAAITFMAAMETKPAQSGVTASTPFFRITFAGKKTLRQNSLLSIQIYFNSIVKKTM